MAMIKKPKPVLRLSEPVKPKYSKDVVAIYRFYDYGEYKVPEGVRFFEIDDDEGVIKFFEKVAVTQGDYDDYEKRLKVYQEKLKEYEKDFKVWRAYEDEREKEESYNKENEERKLLETLKKKYES